MQAREVVAQVVDPELPMLTLEDLGVLRDVAVDDDTVVVTLTPTYSGCPALATMRADVLVALRRAGYERAEVRTTLSPAWSSDWISARGRAALAEHGIVPRHVRIDGPIDLFLMPPTVLPLSQGLVPSAHQPTPARCRTSGPRRADRCTPAGPVARRSTT